MPRRAWFALLLCAAACSAASVTSSSTSATATAISSSSTSATATASASSSSSSTTGSASSVRVANAEQLRAALLAPAVANITLMQSVALGGHRLWQGAPALPLSRSVTLSGPLQPGAPLVALDAGRLSAALVLAPGVVLTLQHLELRNSFVLWQAGLPLVSYSPGSGTRLHHVVRRNPLCTPDLAAWVARTVSELQPPPPQLYTPPPQLYDAASAGPFATRIRALSRHDCEAAWRWPEACGLEAGLSDTVAYVVPASANPEVVGLALHEDYDVLYPCDGYVSTACLRHRSMPACFNAASWRSMLAAHVRPHVPGAVLTALAAVVVSWAWWRRRQQQQQAQLRMEPQLSWRARRQQWQQQLPEQPPPSPQQAKQQEQAGATSHEAKEAAEAPSTPSLAGSSGRQQGSVFGDTAFEGLQLGPILGVGSFGRVYQGTHLGRRVAVKVMEVPAATWSSSAQHELRITQLVEHDNLVRTFGHVVRPLATHGELQLGGSQAGSTPSSSTPLTSSGSGSSAAEPGRSWMQVLLVMELADAGSLREAVLAGRLRSATTGMINMDAVLRAARDVARGLSHLHARNIIHGDLCANNVLIFSSSAVPPPLAAVAKVADFGLSRLLPQQATHLSTLSTGTLTHVAPELFRSQQLRPAADVYSLGVLLWELVSLGEPVAPTGDAGSAGSAAAPAASQPRVVRHPYQHLGLHSPFAFLPAVLAGDRPLWAAQPAVPGAYRALAERCWHADPGCRPSAAHVADLLDAALAQHVGCSGSEHLGEF